MEEICFIYFLIIYGSPYNSGLEWLSWRYDCKETLIGLLHAERWDKAVLRWGSNQLLLKFHNFLITSYGNPFILNRLVKHLWLALLLSITCMCCKLWCDWPRRYHCPTSRAHKKVNLLLDKKNTLAKRLLNTANSRKKNFSSSQVLSSGLRFWHF